MAELRSPTSASASSAIERSAAALSRPIFSAPGSMRGARRALDGLGLLDQLEKAGGWIAAADGTIDTSTRTAKMATTMHFAMAENELERYRETSAVVHERAIVDKGRHMGGTPFG